MPSIRKLVVRAKLPVVLLIVCQICPAASSGQSAPSPSSQVQISVGQPPPGGGMYDTTAMATNQNAGPMSTGQVNVDGNLDRSATDATVRTKPGDIREAPISPDQYGTRVIGPGGAAGFPFMINDANVTGRVAAFVDSTRMNPNALGYFLPSAIPVKGDAYYGSSWQAGVISNGSQAGFDYSAPGTDFGGGTGLNGTVVVGLQASSADTITAIVPQATVKWNWLTVGAQDSTFTDSEVLPESADLAGPIGRPTIRSATGISTQPQVRVSLPNAGDQNNGFFVQFAVEQPGADVLTPVVVPLAAGGVALTPISHYSGFSRFPDLVGKVYYESGGTAANSWTRKAVPYWTTHLECGLLLRDVGVEGDGKGAPTIRDETTGWGVQLSGRQEMSFLSDSDPISGRHDYILFGATYGEGIGHYFADLHMLNAVNDAAYNSTTGVLSPLPVFAFFGAYEHAWSATLRSTVAYSHIDLDSQVVPGNGTSPYKLGDYFSINLVWADDRNLCIPKSPWSSTTSPLNPNCPDGTASQVHLFAGAEYLFGERETLNGNFGTDQRLMFFFCISK